jgi:hypothetical protein
LDTGARVSATKDEIGQSGPAPRWVRPALACLVVLITILYTAGFLDYALYPVGLNLYPCSRTQGGVLCGTFRTDQAPTQAVKNDEVLQSGP